jgi:SAM-dependent methyltransferase
MLSVLLLLSASLVLSSCSKSKAPPKGEPAVEPKGDPAAAAEPHAAGHEGVGAAKPDGAGGHNGMHRGFKGAEEWAKVFDDPARDAWQQPDEVMALLQVTPNLTVADVGAGTGYFVGRLSRAVGPAGFVIATDVEPDMVRYLDQRATREGWPNVRAVAVAASDPGLGEATVDRVLLVDVWHHLGDRRAYAAKLAAALRPGGLIAVVDFDKAAKRGPPPKHRLAPDVILGELRSAGLTAELAAEKLPEQYVVIARAPR